MSTIEKRAWNSDDTALSVLGASTGAGLAYAYDKKINDFNPFGEKNVTVVGGVKKYTPRARAAAVKYLSELAEGKTPNVPHMTEALANKIFALDSFSGQSLAAADALRDAGIKTKVLSRAINSPMKSVDFNGAKINAFDPKSYYRSLDITPSMLRGADAILQVGDGVNDSALESARKSGSKLYRLLSDYGDGNFKQPDYWLGQNWMKVRDPSAYDRLIVPGGAEEGIWDKLGRGRRSNVNVDGIAVSPIFKNTKFEKVVEDPLAMLTIGGGSQGRMSLKNYGAAPQHELKFMGKERTLFDDIMAALREKHGDKAKLRAYLGTTLQEQKPYIDEKTGKLAVDKDGNLLKRYEPSDIPLNKQLKRLQGALDPNSEFSKRLSRSSMGRKALEKIRERYKGLEIVGRVPQSSIAKAYANSDYIFALPGSTSAEFSAIKGDRHGGMIHLIPGKDDWAPRHFEGNAKYTNRIMQPGAKKNIVDLVSKSRGEQILDAVREGGFKNWSRRKPSVNTNSLKPMVDAIKRDIALKRLGRAGKLGLIAAPGALALNHLISDEGNSIASRVFNRKDKTLLGKIKSMLS